MKPNEKKEIDVCKHCKTEIDETAINCAEYDYQGNFIDNGIGGDHIYCTGLNCNRLLHIDYDIITKTTKQG